MRSAATDIFSYLVEYNPSMVREFVMQEAQQNDDVSKKLTEQKITSKVNIIYTNSKYLCIGAYSWGYIFLRFKLLLLGKCSQCQMAHILPLNLLLP